MTDRRGHGVTDPDLMTVAEVARVLRVSDRTVQRWASNGFIPPPINLRGMVRYRQSDITTWLAQRQTETRAGGV